MTFKAGKWNKNALTYKILNKNVELKDQTRFLSNIYFYNWSRSNLSYFIFGNCRNAIAAAFGYWSQHTPLTFSEVCSTCKSDLTVDFAYKDHKDGYPFDGPGGVLAHAFFPEVFNFLFFILDRVKRTLK
jgi:hypothetical protein